MTEVIEVVEAVASDDDDAERAERDDDCGVASAVSAGRSCGGSFRRGSTQSSRDEPPAFSGRPDPGGPGRSGTARC